MKILNRFMPSNTNTNVIQMYMIKFNAFLAILMILTGCSSSSDKGELVGVKGKKWHPEKPFGMALIPGGAFIMGKSDDDLANVQDATTKTVTVRSFYMDETEITNSEYRQFVDWVKDSTIRVRLADLAFEQGLESKGTGKSSSKAGSIGDFAYNNADPGKNPKATPYDKYMYEKFLLNEDDPNYVKKLNHKVKLIKATNKYPDEFYSEVMDSMYLPEKATYNGLKTIDANKLVFRYSWMDIQAAAKAKKGTPRQKFIKQVKDSIYPDTTVWVKDFAYSFNEPMHNDYFWHQAYAKYPVVGVSWKQSRAFCAWRTMYKNAYNKSKKGLDQVYPFRLPLESEWEYAARGGLQSGTYPWGGPYTKNDRGCFLANFKPNRGDYFADNALYTVEAKSYDPNGYGLYNMAGNVSEWTDASYDAATYEFVSSINPTVQNLNNKRKVVRGGSWKDVAYYLQVSTRDFEYADSARSYIGFRTVQDYIETQATGKLAKRK
jgi:gliding motility-associated lipoprotein GldK